MGTSFKPLLTALSEHQSRGGEFVLATIIATSGSTYRKAGARMILSEGGGNAGLLGGGAFEQGLVAAASEVHADRRPRIVDCDMPGPANPGDAGGERDGVARILLQWQGPDNGYAPSALIARSLASGMTGVLVTIVDSTHPGIDTGTSLLHDESATAGLPPDLTAEIESTAHSVIASGKPMLVLHPADGAETEVFYAPLEPPFRLLIAGAGADAAPLVELAAWLGWQVDVVDPRAWLARAEHFPGADRVAAVQPEALEEFLAASHCQAAVVMTHNSSLDERFVRTLAAARVGYIGILGSAGRCQRLLEKLRELPAKALKGIHAPVGLDISADSPEEIAMAIAAEIQQASPALHKRRDSTGAPITNEQLQGLYAVVLAAGASRRFGALKQLLEFEGESLLRRTVRTAAEILGSRVLVVHGPKPTKCQRELATFDTRAVLNENFENGMSLSLKLGIRALPPEATAALVLLCDQPLVGSPQIQALLGAWAESPENIVASEYGGGHGVPVIIPRQHFPEIDRLTGDQGAKPLLLAHAADLVSVPMTEAEMDIDTQDDYTRILMCKPGSGLK